MKRNIFLAIAVTALMVASTIAQAADVSFSGQIRPRFNLDQDSQDDTKTTKNFSSRVRLNAKANVNANTEVFLQLQSIGTWGTASTDLGTRVSTGGGNPAGNQQASDQLSDVGFHQAYVTLKNFAGQGVDAKIGRQEVILDGHRLFGNTGWTQGAETKDAIRLTHAGGNHAINYIYIEASNEQGFATIRNDSANVHVLHTKTQGVLGGALSGYLTITNDAATDTSGSNEENWYTIGARQAGKIAGIDYRVEYYHQLGEAGNLATASGYGITDAAGADRDANMVGVRLGKSFANNSSITLWYDRLSGVDDDDQSGGDWGAFDTMYDTGHKYYGFQDFYLARNGASTRYFGLQDIALKTKMSPRAGWTLKADLHHFRTATDLSGSDADGIITSLANDPANIEAGMDSDLGTEVDLTVVHKYDANTKIVAGYSHYFTTHTFGQLNGAGARGSASNDDSDWAYVMIDTKF
jgi:hypothetical protein